MPCFYFEIMVSNMNMYNIVQIKKANDQWNKSCKNPQADHNVMLGIEQLSQILSAIQYALCFAPRQYTCTCFIFIHLMFFSFTDSCTDKHYY